MARFRIEDDDEEEENEVTTRLLTARQDVDNRSINHFVVPAIDLYDFKKKTFFMKNWLSILSFLILIASLACRFYLPPAPPSADVNDDELSWSSYLREHTQQLFHALKALTVDTPIHVTSWWVYNLWIHLQLLLEDDHSTNCIWSPTPPRNLRQELAKVIQGQELAIELLSDAVLAWERSEPLVVMSVGVESTGKRSLAQQLALQLLDTSASSSPSCSSSSSPTVFHIQGWKYNNDREYFQLLRQLQQHFQLYPNGSLLLWSNVDQSDPHYVHNIMEHIISTAQSRYMNSSIIIYMTTGSSNTMMMPVLAQYLRENNWRSPGLLADLRRKDANSPWRASLSTTAASTSTVVYLPFAPHTPSTLREIVHAHVLNHQHDHDDDHASTLLSSGQVDELLANVEYLDWRTASGEPLRTFAVDGAAAIPFHKLRAMMMKEEETTTTATSLDSKG